MSDPQKTRTVALIDPLWMGHHPVFFGSFAASFLRAGVRVIGLAPNPEAARKEIEAAVGDLAEWDQRLTLAKLHGGGRSWFKGRFEGDPYHTYQRWHLAGKSLRKAESETRWTADLVYFPYLDSYLRFLPFPSVPDITIGRPWSGLYMRNHHHRSATKAACGPLHMLAKGDALIRNFQCREVGVLDERFIEGMEEYLGKRVIHYPDITRTQLPENEPTLTTAIRKKAAGRKIVGLIGLEPRKGTVNLLRVALKAHQLRFPWYFVFAGTFDREAYASRDLGFITGVLEQVAAGGLDNIHFDPEAERIPTEADFNSLFSSFDVAWAAFEGFQGSSNTLSKAAAFSIPCVATAGECIGHRLEKFRAGLTIPERDVEQAIAAIEHLCAGTNRENEPLNPDFSSFNEAHSIERLDQIIRDLLEKTQVQPP